MLSWSASHNDLRIDLRSIVEDGIDPLLPGGAALIAVTDAALTGNNYPAAAKEQLGAGGLVDAIAVVANFQMMNRIADATGMPVSAGSRSRSADLIVELGLSRFDHLAE